MTIGPLPAAAQAALTEPNGGAERGSQEQSARNRELAKAIRAINENAVFGPGSELRFTVDRETGRRLIRIVDRTTNEVINQIPTEEVIRMAAVLAHLTEGEHSRLA